MSLSRADLAALRAIVREELAANSNSARPLPTGIGALDHRRDDLCDETTTNETTTTNNERNEYMDPTSTVSSGELSALVDRHWLARHVERIRKAAKVVRVTPHGLRGTQASISAGAVSVEHVAEALGQTGPAVTRRHYLAKGAEQAGKQRRALSVLQGGAA